MPVNSICWFARETAAPHVGRFLPQDHRASGRQPSRHAEFHACHEVDVEDLPAVGTKDQLQFEALFQARQRACEHGLPASPQEPHVVALGREQAHFTQRHEPAARPVWSVVEPTLDLRGGRPGKSHPVNDTGGLSYARVGDSR